MTFVFPRVCPYIKGPLNDPFCTFTSKHKRRAPCRFSDPFYPSKINGRPKCIHPKGIIGTYSFAVRCEHSRASKSSNVRSIHFCNSKNPCTHQNPKNLLVLKVNICSNPFSRFTPLISE